MTFEIKEIKETYPKSADVAVQELKNTLGEEYSTCLRNEYYPVLNNEEWDDIYLSTLNIAIKSLKLKEFTIAGIKKRIEDHLPWFSIMKDYHSEDKKVRHNAIENACQRLTNYLWNVIWTYYKSYVEKHREELFQEGIIGILEGLCSYDPHFATATNFFWSFIRHQLSAYINATVNHSNAYFQKHLKIIDAKIAEFEKKGIPWSIKDISIATGINTETVSNCIAIKNGNEAPLSLDSEEFTIALGSKNISKSAEDVFIDNSEANALYQALDKIPEREALIVKIYYGLIPDSEIKKIVHNTKTKVTKKAIGDAFGMSESDIARLITSTYKKLKVLLSPNPKPKCINETELAFTERKFDFRNMDI